MKLKVSGAWTDIGSMATKVDGEWQDIGALLVKNSGKWPGWTSYREVTIDNTGGAAKTDWPVKITLSSANFDFTDTASDGSDLQLRASDGSSVLAHWRESWDAVAQIGVVWVKVPSIAAGGSATVRMYYGNLGWADTSDGSAVFTSLFEDFEGDACTTDFAYSSTLGSSSRYGNPVAPLGAAGSWNDSAITELGNYIHDLDDPDPTRRYKMYAGGRKGTSDPELAESSIGVYFSPDRVVWTEYGSNPIIAVGDDPWVVSPADSLDGLWHMWYENPGSPSTSKVNHRISTDGITWGAASVAINTVAGTWRQTKTGSPAVLVVDGVYYMTFDGRSTPDNSQDVGYATSLDGDVWTVAAQPIIVGATAVAASSIVPTDMGVLSDGRYYVSAHNGADKAYVFVTADHPADWNASSFSLLYDRWTESGVTPKIIEMIKHPGGPVQWGSSLGVKFFDLVGGPGRTFLRNTTNKHPEKHLIDLDGSTLRLRPLSTATEGLAVIAHLEQRAFTSNLAVRWRFRSDAIGANRKWTRVSIGAGTPGSLSNDPYRCGPPDGYSITFGEVADGAIAELNSSTSTSLGALFSVAGQDTYADYELRYRSDGTIDFLQDGSLLQSRSDVTNLAVVKDVTLSQGFDGAGTDRGADASYDWVLVRPYDGVDPTATVGAEQAA